MSDYFGTHGDGSRASDSLYDWTLTSGAMGVTDNQYRAMTEATDALRVAEPGTQATVRAVALGGLMHEGYHPLRDIATGVHDPESGAVIWTSSP